MLEPISVTILCETRGIVISYPTWWVSLYSALHTLFPVPDDRVKLLVGAEGEVAGEGNGVILGDGHGRRRGRGLRPVRTESEIVTLFYKTLMT